MIRWLKSWRRRRVLVRTHIQLEALRRLALTAPDFMFRDQLIFLANALLGDLQARGIITKGERRELAVEWIKNYVSALLPMLYRDKNAEAIDRLGCFLKAS